VFVDTNSEEVAVFAKEKRPPSRSRGNPSSRCPPRTANDLLVHHAGIEPSYDFLFPTFRHGPAAENRKHPRRRHRAARFRRARLVLTTIAHKGFFWRSGLPISYQPNDAAAQPGPRAHRGGTTALYGISRDSLLKYRCRIGAKPHFYAVSKIEAVDLKHRGGFCLPRLARHDGAARSCCRGKPLSVLPFRPACAA